MSPARLKKSKKFINLAALFTQGFLPRCIDANLDAHVQKMYINMFSNCSFVSADEFTPANDVNNEMTIRQTSSFLKRESSAKQFAHPGHSETLPSGAE